MMNEFNDLLEQLNNCFTNKKEDNDILVDVKEYETGYEVLANIPGVNKENIKISYDDNYLNISVEKKEDGANESYRLHERKNTFSPRSIYFEDMLDIEKSKAKYESGVLSLYLPKMPKKNTSIKID